MANIKSAIKRIKQNEKRRLRNRGIRSTVRSAVKLVMSAGEAQSATLPDAYRQAVRVLDKSVTKGVFHKNTIARRKSRLARLVNSAQRSALSSQHSAPR